MIAKKICVFLSYCYGIAIICLRIIFDNEIKECENNNNLKSKINFEKMSLSTSFFISFSSFMSLAILINNNCIKTSYYLTLSISFSFGFVHILFFAYDNFPILNCSSNVITLNALFTLYFCSGISIVASIIIGFIGFVLFCSIIGIIDDIIEMSTKKKLNLFLFLWGVSSIILLSIYPTITSVRIIVIIETIILVSVSIIGRNTEYNKLANYIHIGIVLGIISLIIDIQKKTVNAVSINALIPSSIIFSYFFILCKKIKIRNRVSEVALDKSNVSLPPAVFASGSNSAIV